MRKTLLFLMLLSVKLTFGQVSDAFTDGDFIKDPSWTGNLNAFSVNASKQLQSVLNTNNQMVSLSTQNVLATNTKWDFFVQLSFDPSTSNQLRVYLIADQPDLNSALNGYFLQIGESGSTDSYDLYRQDGLIVTKIIDGPAKSRLNVNLLIAQVHITRSDIGKWELYTDILGGTNYTLEGTATDLNFLNTDYFGISCKYTSTRSDGFIFDNFSIQELSPDVKPPELISAKVIDDYTIEVLFSERLDPNYALQTSNYNLLNIGVPLTVLGTNLPNIFKLTFGAILQTGTYKLTVKGLRDLSGNSISDTSGVSFLFVKPRPFQRGDLLISEVLVNPRTGGADFVEIYNNTDQILDLKTLQLANADASGNLANIKNVSNSSVYIKPKTYWVLTTNPKVIMQDYEVKHTDQFVQMSSLPSYNNDKGSVILMDSNVLLDRLDYNNDMHFLLLQNVDGVSLERVSFTKPSNEPGNFTSAAKSVGFATPTYQNSQEILNISKNAVSLQNKIFSPDGDGFEDLLQINYQFVNNGYLVNINIYTDKGVLVRKLERNTSTATQGSFNWDGLNDTGRQSDIGIYIIKFDAFALNGKTVTFKQTCVLAAKLN